MQAVNVKRDAREQGTYMAADRASDRVLRRLLRRTRFPASVWDDVLSTVSAAGYCLAEPADVAV